MPNSPHYDWPFRVGADGQIVTVEQNSDEEVAACMAAVILWPLGTRDDDDEFGVIEQAFLGSGPDLDMIRAALAVNEARALTRIARDDSDLTTFVANVRVGFDQSAGNPS